MQMKYILLASIYYGVNLYFDYVLKYNYVMIKKQNKNCSQ